MNNNAGTVLDEMLKILEDDFDECGEESKSIKESNITVHILKE